MPPLPVVRRQLRVVMPGVSLLVVHQPDEVVRRHADATAIAEVVCGGVADVQGLPPLLGFPGDSNSSRQQNGIIQYMALGISDAILCLVVV